MLEHNSASVVNEIGELSEIDIVTSVVSSSLANIEEWLNENEFNFNKIICASEKGALEYDIFIDDSPYVAMDVVRKDRICLLYDQPWNRNIEFSKLIRIKKLQEIVNIIQNISTG